MTESLKIAGGLSGFFVASCEKANVETEKILADGKKQSDNHKKILVSQANQDAKKEIMAAREKIIDECFVKAHHLLSTLKETEYKNMIRKLMTDGVKKLGGKCTVIVSRDIDKLSYRCYSSRWNV